MEPIDPVRFISNRSTGSMGYKLAEVASKRRHVVTLVSGPTGLKAPKVQKFISIERAGELYSILKKELKRADCLIMCAAVSDYRVRHLLKRKLKRGKKLSLELVPNKDILFELSKYKNGKIFVGFSLETENLIRRSCLKLRAKKLDLIVATRLTKYCKAFGDSKLDAYIIDKSRDVIGLGLKTKVFIAHVLLDKIEKLWYLKNSR